MRQIDEINDIDVLWHIAKNLGNDLKASKGFQDMLERIRIVSNTIQEARNQDDFMDGYGLTTNIEAQIDNKKSDEQ